MLVAQIKSFLSTSLSAITFVFPLFWIQVWPWHCQLINVMPVEPWKSTLGILFIFLDFCYCHDIKSKLACWSPKDHEDTLVRLVEVLPEQIANLRCMRKSNKDRSRMNQISRPTKPNFNLWTMRKVYCFSH